MVTMSRIQTSEVSSPESANIDATGSNIDAFGQQNKLLYWICKIYKSLGAIIIISIQNEFLCFPLFLKGMSTFSIRISFKQREQFPFVHKESENITLQADHVNWSQCGIKNSQINIACNLTHPQWFEIISLHIWDRWFPHHIWSQHLQTFYINYWW